MTLWLILSIISLAMFGIMYQTGLFYLAFISIYVLIGFIMISTLRKSKNKKRNSYILWSTESAVLIFTLWGFSFLETLQFGSFVKSPNLILGIVAVLVLILSEIQLYRIIKRNTDLKKLLGIILIILIIGAISAIMTWK